MTWRKALLGVSALAFAAGAAAAAHADVLPVTNLEFNVLNGSFQNGHTKEFFNVAAPSGWSVGNGSGNLIYVGKQGSEGTEFQDTGNIYKVYTNPGFSTTVPAGTNFYQADGNPMYESTIFQTVSGLVAGTTYTLQFQQASGQQVGFSGDTTEQWKVFLGVGGIGTNCSGDPCTVTGTAGNIEQDSTLMNTTSEHNVDWNSVTLSFTPTAAELTNGTAVLTFLAWGDDGHTTNLPPTVFLEGVNTIPVLPEPAALSVLGVGLLGLGAAVIRRRKSV